MEVSIKTGTKVCVIGGTGFIGSHFVEYFQENPAIELVATSRAIPDQAFLTNKVRWLIGDLRSIDFCRELVTCSDIFIHLAHSSYPLTSGLDLSGEILNNVLPTTNLLNAIYDSNKKPHMIFISSAGAVYGQSIHDEQFVEDVVCNPCNSYGIQKLTLEHLIRLWAIKGYLTSTVLRVANAYGSVFSASREQGLIGLAAMRILAGQPVSIIGSLENVRDYIHVKDVYDAVVKCLYRRAPFEVFNIGTGKGTSVAQVLELLESLIGRRAELTLPTNRCALDLPSWNVPCCEKAAKILKWRHKIGLKDGLEMMLRQFAGK